MTTEIFSSSLITNWNDFRIGDFVIVNGAGPTFTILSAVLSHYDEDWKNLPAKPWHVGFLSRYVPVEKISEQYPLPGWYFSEAKGGVGITESHLSTLVEPFLVFRWFEEPIAQEKVTAFIDTYRGEKYDKFLGYFFVILWYYWPKWPFIFDYNWMCWEWLWFFAMSFGKPITTIHSYPFLPLLLDRIPYPGWRVSPNRIVLAKRKLNGKTLYERNLHHKGQKYQNRAKHGN